MVSKKSETWPNPEKSIGPKTTVIKRDTIWEATGPAAELFDKKIFQKIDQLLKDNTDYLQSGEKILWTTSFHVWMVGRDSGTAKPTVIFACKDKQFRSKVIKLLEEKGVLSEFPGMDLKGLPRMPAQSMGGKLDDSPFSFLEDPALCEEDVYLNEQCINLCGGAIITDSNRQATLGGLVIIDGTYYGLTALHSQRDCNDGLESLGDDNVSLKFDDDSDMTSAGSFPEDYHDKDFANEGALMIVGGSMRSIFPESCSTYHQSSAESKLTVHEAEKFQKFSTVRLRPAQNKLDYEIFPVDNAELHVGNKFFLPILKSSSQKVLNVKTIATEMVETEVWAATSRSGVLRGTLINNPYYIKMAGSESFQKMWPVQLDKNIVAGDCGSWVVDNKGRLYGHLVARDARFNRAYFIAAIDIFNDIQTTFGAQAVLPTILTPKTESQPLHLKERCLTRPTPGKSLLFRRGETSSPVNSFYKRWEALFSVSQDFNQTQAFVQNLGESCSRMDSPDVLALILENGLSYGSVKELGEFYETGNLSNLMLGIGLAGHRRAARLDDRSLGGAAGEEHAKEHQAVLSATELYRFLTLSQQKSPQQTLYKHRRLIHIQDLDSFYILALVEAAPVFQLSMIRDAIWKHLEFQTAISVTIAEGPCSIFQLQLHISFYTLSKETPPLSSPQPAKGGYSRRWIDLSFLSMKKPRPLFQSFEALSVREAQISLLMCGLGDSRWFAYHFVDTVVEEAFENLRDEDILCEGIPPELDSALPIWDPREYFLAIFQFRTQKVRREWESLVHFIEWSVREEHEQPLPTSPSGRLRARDSVEARHHFEQTLKLLDKLIGVLSNMIITWKKICSPSGDILYFVEHPSVISEKQSLLAIRETIDILENLQRTLERLRDSSLRTMEIRQWGLLIESHSIAHFNKKSLNFIAFTISLIPSLMVGIAFYSIPSGRALFALKPNYFLLGIICIIIILQLLFIAIRFLPNSSWWWNKINSVVNKVYVEYDKMRSQGNNVNLGKSAPKVRTENLGV